MKTTSLFPKAAFCCALLLTIFSCSKDDAPAEDGYLVEIEVLSPTNGSLVEASDFDVEAIFTPYGYTLKVDIIQMTLLEAQYGYEIGHVRSQNSPNTPNTCAYHYTGTGNTDQKGAFVLEVCSYKNESVTVGHYSYLTNNGPCENIGIFAQDKVGEDFQVRTELLKPYQIDYVALSNTLPIDYRYSIKKGGNGILTVEILDASNNVIDTLLETEISDSGEGQLSYQFAEAGTYYIKLKAQQPDGSDENSWVSMVLVQ